MALSAGSGGTTIAKSAQNGASVYIVPAGKTFEGHMWGSNTVGPGVINGTQLYWPNYSNYYAHVPLPVTLNGGDEVKANGSGWVMLVGVIR